MIGRPVRAALLRGVSATGTYDPDEVLGHIEERLTGREVAYVRGFLCWCQESNKTFGRANLDERLDEYAKEGR